MPTIISEMLDGRTTLMRLCLPKSCVVKRIEIDFDPKVVIGMIW